MVEQPAGNSLIDNSPTPVVFLDTTIGSNRSLTFTIRNIDPVATLVIGAITKDGTNQSEFTITQNPPAPIPPNGSTTFIVRFAPSSPGTRIATLHIANGDCNESPFDIHLSGIGQSATVYYTVTPSAGPNGVISPNTVQTVSSGGSVSFGVVISSGYVVDQWRVDGGVAQNGGNTLTLNSVTANKTVNVTFTLTTMSGTLDPTFGGTGKVITPISGGDDVAYGVAIQSDGKIVVAGRSGSDFALARYKSDGSLDTLFGGTGKVTTDFGSDQDAAQSVAIQNDGKIIAAGYYYRDGYADFALARYNANGTLDTTFGGTGKVTTAISNNRGDVISSIALQDDGRIVVAGYVTNGSSYDFALARYNPNGSLDPTFGGTGKVITSISGGDDVAYGVAIQSDGKIVVAGRSGSDFALVRYKPDGSLDTLFGGTGKVTTDFGSDQDAAQSVAIQSDGKIIAAGYYYRDGYADFALARYNANGTLDTTFGGTGKVTTAISNNRGDVISSIALQDDGRIVVAGYVTNGSSYDFALARYNPNGSLDPTFGGTGKVITSISGGDDVAYGVAIQSDGKIVVAGRSGSDFAVARYLGTFPLSTLANISTRLRVETGDNALIGGFIVTGTQPKRVIVRAIGPSLSSFFPGTLVDPILELRNSSGGLIASNDNWRSTQEAEIITTGIPPSNNLESAIVATLPANGSAYTAIVRGVNNGTGIGVVEAYDLDRTVDSKLANISTRGLVQTGDNVLIGGFILSGGSGTNVLVRAIGPTLAQAGVNGALQDPTLELYDASGTRIALNDDWRSDQQQEIMITTLPPRDDRESAILRTLSPGNYTAIVRGKANTTGVALVEAYVLQ